MTLSPTEAGHGILKFTGALTVDINVFVPRSPTFKWQIKNATTGAHTLTVKHSTGIGASVTVAQGYNSSLWTDGTNIYESVTIVGFTPVGGIIMWPRPIADIPSNWALCDGTRGTPNLTGMFPFGADADRPIGETGGSANAVVVDHIHTIDDSSMPNGTNGADINGIIVSTVRTANSSSTPSKDAIDGIQSGIEFGDNNASSVSRAFSIKTKNPDGSDGTVDGVNANLPPYYALYFIMRIS